MLALLTQWCVSDLYVRFNGECTLYRWNYLHHEVYQITMSDFMMNVQTCVTDYTTYTMLYIRPLCLINDECKHPCYCWHYLHHVVCQINMSDIMMNVHIYVTDNTTQTMVYVRTLCQIQCWMYTHVLLITLFTPCFMSDHYVWFNDECTYMWYW